MPTSIPCPCINFEPNRLEHVRELTPDGRTHGRNPKYKSPFSDFVRTGTKKDLPYTYKPIRGAMRYWATGTIQGLDRVCHQI